MKSIQILSPLVANQIAAGEVVERPVSVIKELVENSLDAGASQIDVTLLQGGLSFIQVQDNGHGIPKDELALSLTRHATSKIESPDDLMEIQSLGFRGEALASIISVAKCELSSKPKGQTQGWSVAVKGSALKPYLYPASKIDGTTVTVRDLFYNVPARRKFLKSVRTEFVHVDQFIKGAALAHPSVSFSFTHNEKRHRHYVATTEQKRCQQVLGKSFMDNAFFLEYQTAGYLLHGWMTSPSGFKKSTDGQFFYINGRLIRDKVILHAIKQTLDLLELDLPGAYPSYVLFLSCPVQEVDVNVHPTKHEVRFSDPSFVHDFVQKALRLTFESSQTPSRLPESKDSKDSTPRVSNAALPASADATSLKLPSLNLNLEVFKPKLQSQSFMWEHFLFNFKPKMKITHLKRDKDLIWKAFFKWSQTNSVPRRICLFPHSVQVTQALEPIHSLGFILKRNVKGAWQLVEVPSFVTDEVLLQVIHAIENNPKHAKRAVKEELVKQNWTLFKQDSVFQTMLECSDFSFQQTISVALLNELLEPVKES